MKKELIISVVVIALVVILNIITTKHTNTVMDEIAEELSIIREELLSKNDDNVREKIEFLAREWKNKSENLAYYIEHDELEKVELYIVEAKSNIETEEYNMAVQSIDSCKFIISHIKDKYEFKLVNIF